MRFRVLHKNNNIYNFSTYFRTKKEAVEYQKVHGGTVQRKIGCEWFSY